MGQAPPQIPDFSGNRTTPTPRCHLRMETWALPLHRSVQSVRSVHSVVDILFPQLLPSSPSSPCRQLSRAVGVNFLSEGEAVPSGTEAEPGRGEQEAVRGKTGGDPADVG